MPNLTGYTIGRYHILEQLGEGGMATVYKAYDTRLERNVALKVLRTDQFIPAQLHMVLQRFEREAKSLAKLKHSNIVNILDFGEHEGTPYLVMEYLPGGTLKQKLGQTIHWQKAIQTLIPIARGLSYAHQHGVIHRDVKPANILIDQNEEPILTDFGIAKLLEGTKGYTITGSGVGIGTPEYMAPEQGIGAHTIDARADIYSLGIVLYEMVTGRKPYIADTPMAVVLKQMTDPLPPPTDFVPDLPEGVEHILFKALAKQADDRYEDMNVLIAAMESVLAETKKIEVPAPIKWVKKRAAPHIRPSPKVATAVIGALAVILVITFGGPWMIKRFSAESEAGATSTKVSDAPSSTFTLPPTKTLVSSPSPTLTLTLRPTTTNTAVPSWVTDFAETILAAIKGREPNFQDDFSVSYGKGWYPRSWRSSQNEWIVEDGVLAIKQNENSECNSASNDALTHPNFVLQVDLPGPHREGDVEFHGSLGGGPRHYFNVNSDTFSLKWGFGVRDIENQVIGGLKKMNSVSDLSQVIIVKKGSKAAFYLDEVLLAYTDDADLDIPVYGVLFNCGRYDNVKFWNLDKILNLP